MASHFAAIDFTVKYITDKRKKDIYFFNFKDEQNVNIAYRV